MSDGPSIPTRLGWIFREFATIRPDRTPRVAPFDELQHPVGEHHKFDAIVVAELAWPTERIAFQHPIFGVSYSSAVWRLKIGPRGVENLFPIRRQIRKIWRPDSCAVLI